MLPKHPSHYETQESLFQKDIGSSACGCLVAQIAGEGGQSIPGCE